ncbi:predicted protein [Naegleria gruberi]|uniref:Predicted protein n=1 Tax=Naegleria gruberi TaxID=5762 RepID=D2VNX2_NAEGR|nr:uncharacterized protein NAEGRDRAFT_70649 [Naegleria gruberi]EFC41493.1 predicted protein [Naegleria gruberi]|eukprot:XP_002674237.1 predicted protein [Naegleria gruberi strain NEG-M]
MAPDSVVLYLDLISFESELLSSKIRDVPMKDKFKLIWNPIYYSFAYIDEEDVAEDEQLEREKFDYLLKNIYSGEYMFNLMTNADIWKIDLIRDQTFIIKQLTQISWEKFAEISTRLNLWKLKSFAEKFVECLGRYVLVYIPIELRSNRKFMLHAIKLDRHALGFASEEIRNDREIVMESVKQTGWVLKHASDELKRDKTIVLHAVKQNGHALQFASEELRNDREIDGGG